MSRETARRELEALRAIVDHNREVLALAKAEPQATTPEGRELLEEYGSLVAGQERAWELLDEEFKHRQAGGQRRRAVVNRASRLRDSVDRRIAHNRARLRKLAEEGG